MSASALPPTASTTLVILLGASAWPNSPGFQASEAFAHAAGGFRDYVLDPQDFGLPAANLQDLFDALASGATMSRRFESSEHGCLAGKREGRPCVAQVIEQAFGVRYHRDHVGRLLCEAGWSRQQPIEQASYRNEEAIKQSEQRWPAIQKAEQDKAAIVLVDEAGF